MPTRFALALALIALAIFAVYGDQIVVTFYVLDATRVLPFWQVAAVLGLAGIILAYRPS